MTLKHISDELINAYLDGEIQGPLKDEIAAAISADPELLASYLELSAANDRVQQSGAHVLDYVDARAAPDFGLGQHMPMRSSVWGSMFAPVAFAASLMVAVGLGFVWGEGAQQGGSDPLAATWIYRATGAHQIASVGEAWTPVTSLEQIPATFSPLLSEYRGEDALLQLGYKLQGWRVAGDGHAPVAIQIAYRKDTGELATAFLRRHVEGGQSSAAMVINGVPTFFTGGNNVDTALIGFELPYEDEDWQEKVTSSRRG